MTFVNSQDLGSLFGISLAYVEEGQAMVTKVIRRNRQCGDMRCNCWCVDVPPARRVKTLPHDIALMAYFTVLVYASILPFPVWFVRVIPLAGGTGKHSYLRRGSLVQGEYSASGLIAGTIESITISSAAGIGTPG